MNNGPAYMCYNHMTVHGLRLGSTDCTENHGRRPCYGRSHVMDPRDPKDQGREPRDLRDPGLGNSHEGSI